MSTVIVGITAFILSTRALGPQFSKKFVHPTVGYRCLARWFALMICSLMMAGCALQPSSRLAVFPPPPIATSEPLPMSFEEQQQMIMHLLQVLSQKEGEISQLRAHQQSQVKELKETTSQAARAEIKLRRFATEADVASQLAEVEVAMGILRSTLGTERKASLQLLAQRLLDTATTSFKQGKYSIAADLVAQAEQFIAMLMDNHSTTAMEVTSEVPFKVAIPLKVKVDSHLRHRPNSNAAVLDILHKTTPVIARAYQGQWLYVQTDVGDSGWVMIELLEAP